MFDVDQSLNTSLYKFDVYKSLNHNFLSYSNDQFYFSCDPDNKSNF